MGRLVAKSFRRTLLDFGKNMEIRENKDSFFIIVCFIVFFDEIELGLS